MQKVDKGQCEDSVLVHGAATRKLGSWSDLHKESARG